MKKFLAAVLAAAMVVSMTAVASFAATATKSVQVLDLAGLTGTVSTIPVITIGTATLTGDSLGATAGTDDTAAKLAASFDGKSTAVVTGYTASVSGTKITLTATATGVTATLGATYTITNTTGTSSSTAVSFTPGTAATSLDAVAMDIVGPFVEGTGDMVKGIVKPGKTLYYTISQDYAENSEFIKLTLSKGDSSKNIESVKLVEKKFDGELVYVSDSTKKTTDTIGGVTTTSAKNRQYFVAVKLKDQMIDSEYKVNFKIKASVKKASSSLLSFGAIAVGDNLAEKTYDSAWVNNNVETGDDLSYKAGTGGVMSKPVKDENNTVTWEDENRTLATMVFTADSSVSAYYPKLSTQWDNEFYGMHFATDAYKFEFVGNPTISATARPVLSLMNPFIVDDEYTVDVAELTVYRVVDGALVDATAEFTATTNDDGEQVLVTKTRTLGTYVVTDAAAILEAAETTVPEKVVPNTGR